ncbi:cation diffusion facilitator family transporter [Streptacidiphilus sp. PB12-B1b]|uniref:cation diffusion facilitator family transporter n=1 Tax=Streptacidiphilus sp. PB12-B1b TaxID=2705012 RepID=UPI001CDC9B13|nr:cation diffusion facilitator family transporter [Streptacidiphilus sp. PB12-B1b]
MSDRTAPHEHPHEHPHPHGHDHPHAHDRPAPGRWARLRHRAGHAFTPHSHEPAAMVDTALETSAEGMRTLWISLVGLAATAAVQGAVVLLSGSVSLLGDAVHNAADALTALPLAAAFLLGRRGATRRYTYGYGRAEDLAGVFIVATVAASSALTAIVAVDRLLHPRPIGHLPVVAVAALVGFAGNEWVARYRVRTGRRIGSAALVADGLHARTDGFTSLAVLLGAGGAALGWRLADPLVGLVITGAILLVLRGTAREILGRLMDAVDPVLVDSAETALRRTPGVVDVGQLRMRWLGHRLRAEVAIVVDGGLTVRQAHDVAVEAEHALLHAVPRLGAALVHPDPAPGRGCEPDPHAHLAHHRARRTTAGRRSARPAAVHDHRA